MVFLASLLTNVESSTDFEGCASPIPNVIAFLAFGALCFVIGRKCVPQVSGYEVQEAEIKHLKRQVVMLESGLAQQQNYFTTRGVAGDDTTGSQSQKELKTALEKVSAQKDYFQGEWQKAMTELAGLKEEVRGARRFLSMEDEYSGAEVIKHVERLNAAIMQAAANMAERFDVEALVPLEISDEDIVQRAENLVGVPLMKLLRTLRRQGLLELAFQTAMALYTQKIASSWCFRSLEDEELVQNGYMSMRQDKLQSIFGRWRQLTRTHLRISKSANEGPLIPHLAEDLVDIVVAAGHRESPSNVRQIVMTSFPAALSEIIDSAKELNRMIGEGVTSFDIHVAFVEPNKVYDPAQMVEADGSTPGEVREKVVCTTELGLVGIRKTSNSTDMSVMLKAKVILPSMLAGIEDT